MDWKTGSYDPIARIQSQIRALLHLSVSFQHFLFCIECNGLSLVEYFRLECHQVQNMKVLNFSIVKLILIPYINMMICNWDIWMKVSSQNFRAKIKCSYNSDINCLIKYKIWRNRWPALSSSLYTLYGIRTQCVQNLFACGRGRWKAIQWWFYLIIVHFPLNDFRVTRSSMQHLMSLWAIVRRVRGAKRKDVAHIRDWLDLKARRPLITTCPCLLIIISAFLGYRNKDNFDWL